MIDVVGTLKRGARELIAHIDFPLLLITLTIMAVGLATVHSATYGGNERMLSQAGNMGVALVIMWFVARLPPHKLMGFAIPLYIVGLLLLVAVFMFGIKVNGAKRWLSLGFTRIQPSEIMKIAMPLMLAWYFHKYEATLRARHFVVAALLLVIPFGLIAKQPDLGTALAITFGGVVVMFLAGLPLRWFIGAGLAAAITAPIAFFTLLHDYQRNRVLTFLDPESDPLGTGYHITQSKIAIGSGGMFGKGFGQGSQSHLEYLPEAHTDFVFATMAEEWGMLGGLFVLLVFALIFRWGLAVALDSRDRFSQLLAAGMTTTIFFYVAINLMMVMGLAPVVGIPLPFVSHGGSSMMTNMICIGTIMAVSRWQRGSGGLS